MLDLPKWGDLRPKVDKKREVYLDLDYILHGKLVNIPCDFCGNKTDFSDFSGELYK